MTSWDERDPISKHRLIEELYEVLKANPVTREHINWEVFAKRAGEAGLHYDERLGLISQSAWELIQPMLKDENQ